MLMDFRAFAAGHWLGVSQDSGDALRCGRCLALGDKVDIFFSSCVYVSRQPPGPFSHVLEFANCVSGALIKFFASTKVD